MALLPPTLANRSSFVPTGTTALPGVGNAEGGRTRPLNARAEARSGVASPSGNELLMNRSASPPLFTVINNAALVAAAPTAPTVFAPPSPFATTESAQHLQYSRQSQSQSQRTLSPTSASSSSDALFAFAFASATAASSLADSYSLSPPWLPFLYLGVVYGTVAVVLIFQTWFSRRHRIKTGVSDDGADIYRYDSDSPPPPPSPLRNDLRRNRNLEGAASARALRVNLCHSPPPTPIAFPIPSASQPSSSSPNSSSRFHMHRTPFAASSRPAVDQLPTPEQQQQAYQFIPVQFEPPHQHAHQVLFDLVEPVSPPSTQKTRKKQSATTQSLTSTTTVTQAPPKRKSSEFANNNQTTKRKKPTYTTAPGVHFAQLPASQRDEQGDRVVVPVDVGRLDLATLGDHCSGYALNSNGTRGVLIERLKNYGVEGDWSNLDPQARRAHKGQAAGSAPNAVTRRRNQAIQDGKIIGPVAPVATALPADLYLIPEQTEEERTKLLNMLSNHNIGGPFVREHPVLHSSQRVAPQPQSNIEWREELSANMNNANAILQLLLRATNTADPSKEAVIPTIDGPQLGQRPQCPQQQSVVPPAAQVCPVPLDTHNHGGSMSYAPQHLAASANIPPSPELPPPGFFFAEDPQTALKTLLPVPPNDGFFADRDPKKGVQTLLAHWDPSWPEWNPDPTWPKYEGKYLPVSKFANVYKKTAYWKAPGSLRSKFSKWLLLVEQYKKTGGFWVLGKIFQAQRRPGVP
ncbi:hypothetical protein DFH09DRAFT_1103547 [Mycena vulgaris]|nr:hypothetical protein DFH09DRAFT_1103547 [Mycena vulgaris]